MMPAAQANNDAEMQDEDADKENTGNANANTGSAAIPQHNLNPDS